MPIVSIDDAHFKAKVNVAVSSQFFGWIMALGKDITIIGPESVVREMCAGCRNNIKCASWQITEYQCIRRSMLCSCFAQRRICRTWNSCPHARARDCRGLPLQFPDLWSTAIAFPSRRFCAHPPSDHPDRAHVEPFWQYRLHGLQCGRQ